MTTDLLTSLTTYTDSLPAHIPAALGVAAGASSPGAAGIAPLLSGMTQAVDSLIRNPLPVDVFGSASHLAGSPAPAQLPTGSTLFLTDNLPYKLIVLVCFIGLCLLAHAFRPHLRTLLRMFRSKLYVEKLLDEQSYTFDTFLRLTSGGGVLLCGVAMVRFADLFFGREIATLLPFWAIRGLALALWGVAGFVAFYRRRLLKTVGNLTLSSHFTDRLIRLKRLVFSLGTLLLAPTLLLFALTGGTAGTILGWLLAGEMLCLVLFLLYQTWTLFIGQNISILHWILYLCAVEIFPISLLLVLLSKNG